MRFADLSAVMGTVFSALILSACAGEQDLPESETLSDELRPGALKAELIDSAGNALGTVKFDDEDGNVDVKVKVSGLSPGFHGMHLHANDNPANGDGCVAPGFASADAHLNPAGNVHGEHAGDMPVLMVLDDGSGKLRFETDRVTLAELTGRVVIIHAAPDNFHNIPVGPNADQYTPNSPAATMLTDATGNAGARVGCGVIEG